MATKHTTEEDIVDELAFKAFDRLANVFWKSKGTSSQDVDASIEAASQKMPSGAEIDSDDVVTTSVESKGKRKLAEKDELITRITIARETLAAMSTFPDDHAILMQIFLDAMMDYAAHVRKTRGECHPDDITVIDKLFETALLASIRLKTYGWDGITDEITYKEIMEPKKRRTDANE